MPRVTWGHSGFSITSDICGEPGVESREWPNVSNIYGGVEEVAFTQMLWFVVGNDGGSDARMEGDQKIGTYLLPDLLKNKSLSDWMTGEVMLEWRGIKKIIKAYLLPDLLKSKSLSDCTLKFSLQRV